MTLNTTVRNAAVNAIVDLFDGGSVVFETAANNEVATCTFGTPAFGSASGGTATVATVNDDTSATGGIVDHAHMKNSGGTPLIDCTCTVTGGGGDFELTNLTIGAGDTVSITSLSVTQPAAP